MEEEKSYKLKIDIARGLFEAEGSEEFVKRGFDSFKEVVKEKGASFVVVNENGASAEYPVNEKKANSAKKVSKSSNSSIIKDLNLKPKDGKSLKEFYAEKNPESNIERNTVFVYYLEKILNINDITADHIFTCYKEMGLKIPLNLRQSIFDTASSRYGYLDGSDTQHIKLIIRGENFVEHDLPKQKG